MTGLIGFSSGYEAMMNCDTLLLLGTDFPYRQFFPDNAKICQIDLRAENLGRRCRLDLGLVGDVGSTIKALLPRLKAATDDKHLASSVAHYKKAREGLNDLAVGKAGSKPIHPQYVAKVVSDLANEDAVFACDVGTLSAHEWQAQAAWLVCARLDGQRHAAGDWCADGLSRSADRQPVR
jgi:pyruvate dehydrogenase (quinone)